MNESSTQAKARIIRANTLLQAKVGSGDIEPARIQAVQKKMDSLTYDFSPLAQQFMDDLHKNMIAVEKGGASGQAIEDLIRPVMQLKANAPMFGYGLIGALAYGIMTLLESVDEIDKDVLEILFAHHRTLDIILKNKMTGSGGDYGAQLQNELQQACNRYYRRHGLTPMAVNNNDSLMAIL